MTAEACRAAFNAAPIIERGPVLDATFPQCACEPWSLREVGGDGIPNTELVARILTSPDDYDETTSTIITGRLTQLYSMGMSVIRQGAPDAEIIRTVNDLLNGGAEVRKLFGAVVITAEQLRSYVSDDALRWFGLYSTDDRDKTHHADVFGTTVNKKQQSRRRGHLADEMVPLIVTASDTGELIARLRNAGI
jgi:hypothetical protein